MRTLVTLTILCLFWLHTMAQSPQKLSYQCVVRNASGDLVTSQSVGMKISILQGTSSGAVVFAEKYTPNPVTNSNGLVTVEIGSGTPLTGTFAGINWGAGPYFLKTETDPSGGTAYTISGTSQLLSVPYALQAKTVENVATDATLSGSGTTVAPLKIAQQAATSGQVLKWDGTTWKPAADATGTNFTLPYTGGATTAGYIFSLTCDGGFGLKSVAWGPGITGESTSPGGVGVLGKSVTGVYGNSEAVTGIGVRGYANSASGITYGVKGESSSPNGFGIYGINFSTSGSAIGVYGDTQSPTGIGVYGSTASSGNGKAIYGLSNSTGYSGYFLGGQVYIDTKLGIGKGAAYPLDVVGTANLLNGISSGVALRCNGDEAIWYDGTYYSWGYAATFNYFKQPVGINCFPGDGHLLAVNGVASKPGGGSWVAFSDIRLKDIRGNYERGLSDIIRLQPVRFNYKKDNSLNLPSEREYVGFVAQEVQKAFPESVTENKNGYLEFDMSGVNVAVINALKELKAENDVLSTENQQLRQNYSQLNDRLEKLEKLVGTGARNF